MSVMAPPRPRSSPDARPSSEVRQEPRVRINNVSWEEYVAIGEILVDRPALRMTYSNGTLEIMTTSHEHEAWKMRLNRLLELLLDELEMAFTCAGNMTFQREDLKRGFEPDNCYWIANERRMRDHDDYNPT